MAVNQIDPGKMATGGPAPMGAPKQVDANNIVPAAMPSLFAGTHSEAVKALYASVVDKASSVELWYRNGKNKKKWGAVCTRVAAVVLTAAAAMTPIVRELWPLTGKDDWKAVPIAAMFAALAATSVALDRLLGFSSGWVRYIGAMGELQTKLEIFRFSWNQLALEDQVEPKPPQESLAKALALLSGLMTDVRDVLRNETQAWAIEFKTALAELDKATEAQKAETAALPTTGSIRVKVKDADQLDGRSYKVQLNDGPWHEGVGPTLARNNLQPGQVKVRLEAKKAQVAVSAEDIAVIRPGEVATLELELS
jgi:hypothetical protein